MGPRPQQLLGGEAQASDDIYSLGATLYELLSGRRPFCTGDISKQICEVEPLPLNQRRAEYAPELEPVSAEWEAVVMACLAKQPEGRPASVGAVLARLGLVAENAPVPAVAKPLAELAPATGGVPRWVPLAAGIALIVGLGWFFGVHQPAEAKRKGEVARLEEPAKLKVEAEAKAKLAAPNEPARATRYSPYVNSLGMKFIPVPGTDVLFSNGVHDMR